MKSLAPVVLFTYNRPMHLLKVIESLLLNKESKETDLIIYSDGYKNGLDKDQVLACRKVIIDITGFKSLKIVTRDNNLGLAESVISGATEILNQYGKGIFLEDDLTVSSNFLSFMNEGLDKFANNHNIASIHGYVYPHNKALPDYFFLKGADCWGWATWSRAWEKFDKSAESLEIKLRSMNAVRKFNFNNSYKYFEMLIDNKNKLNDSWAIRWYASAFVNNLYTLYPNKSFVQNIGLDGSGSNGAAGFNYFNSDFNTEYKPIEINTVKENKKAYNAFVKYFKTLNKVRTSLIYRVLKKIRNSKNIETTNWIGPFGDWDEVQSKATGYSSELIINKTLLSARLVRDGKAIFERDSVIFDKIQYSWPVLSFMLKSSLGNISKFTVVDFGGGFGSHYYQNKSFFESIKTLTWIVVEQPKMIEIGKNEFENGHLKFLAVHEIQNIKVNVCLLSSVLPYINEYQKIVDSVLNLRPEYIIIDRTFIGNKDCIMLQIVNKSIYDGEYPVRIYSFLTLYNLFKENYDLIFAFDASDGLLFNEVYSKGYIWKRKN